jgi:hypothetical protein
MTLAGLPGTEECMSKSILEKVLIAVLIAAAEVVIRESSKTKR